MMAASYEVETRKAGLLKRNEMCVLTIKSTFSNIGIQLLFDAKYDKHLYKDWKRCLEEATYINNSPINRLLHAKLTIHSIHPKAYIRMNTTPRGYEPSASAISDAEEKGKIYFYIKFLGAPSI